jgi:Mn-containing catalase
MFQHIKALQFDVRVAGPDPRFATMLQEQFGGANGELAAAMRYFTQAIALREKAPKQYDMLMDIATEELSHLEIVGSLIKQLLNGLDDDLKAATERCDWIEKIGANKNDQLIHQATLSPVAAVLGGGGPGLWDSEGVPFNGKYVDTVGEPTVDLRSNIAAESRAKIVYERLKQFTDDPGVQDTLSFLMTREVAHFQQFTAALNAIPQNFPPAALPGDPRFQNLAFNMSNGSESVRGPWNEGQGPWPEGMEWEYIEDPQGAWLADPRRENKGAELAPNGEPAIKGVALFAHEAHELAEPTP